MSLTTKSVSLQAMHVERFLSGSVWKRQAVFLPFSGEYLQCTSPFGGDVTMFQVAAQGQVCVIHISAS